MDGSQNVLKQDAQGRVRTPRARQEELLEEFGRSGLSGPKFAAMVGVKYSTFAAWVFERRKKRLSPAPAQRPLRLVEAVLPRVHEAVAPCLGVLPVDLGGGMRMEISDESQVRVAVALIKALRSC